MSDVRQGKLVVRAVKKGKQLLVELPTKKGSHTLPVNEQAALSADLQGLPMEQLHGLEVECEIANNQPIRVRRAGQTWQPPQTAAARPYPQGQGQRGTQPATTLNRHQGQRSGQQQAQAGSQQQAQQQALASTFHNPYNFVPAPLRQDVQSELGDRPPVGHHRYHPRLWSGRITVKLTTETPLLIPDAALATTDRNGHKTYPVRLTADGMPYLAPTSVKGMLRTAYEAITNSQMGIFYGHDDRLAYRMEAGEGLALVPARIKDNCVELLLGTTADIPTYDLSARRWSVPDNLMYAAWLPRYDQRRGGIAPAALLYPDGSLPEHDHEVWAWIEKFEHWSWDGRRQSHRTSPDFYYWRIRSIAPSEQYLSSAPPPSLDPGKASGRAWHRPTGEAIKKMHGFVCITNQNISRKHDERVFFIEDGYPNLERLRVPLQAPLGKDPLATQWRELIDNYQSAHRERDVWKRREHGKEVSPEAYIGREPGKTAWSRHIYQDGRPRRDNGRPQPDVNTLSDDMLCYARVERIESGYRILALYPVMIARKLFKLPPGTRLDPSLQPALSISQLSPADRVFGWVSQDGAGTYRGNLRVGSVMCEEWPGKNQGEKPFEEFPDRGVPLAILGQPKPQQVRFYVAKNAAGEPLDQGSQAPKKEDCYVTGQGLRGRKVYPHHAGLSTAYWQEPTEDRTQMLAGGRFQEYRRPHKGEKKKVYDRGREHEVPVTNPDGSFRLLQGDTNEQRDDQNRSMMAWVKYHTTFVFDMHVSNLSDMELGALLWLLSLPAGHVHRLGGGKPLGFGSVRLEIRALELRDGDAWAAWYRSLTTPVIRGRSILTMTDDPYISCVRDFKQMVEKAYGNGKAFDTIPFVQAFLRSCQGFADNLPVHYPRLSTAPDPDGENFKWFGKNEKSQRPVALGALYDLDPGLPQW